jgi:hypothetical protein
MPKVIYALVVFALVTVLALVIWQPVFPSGWIIQGMAKQIDPGNISLDKPAVLRFELAGKGGGYYNLMLSKEKVEVTEGDTNQVDLIIAMKATDFNQLMFQMARGKADEFVFAKLVISNVLKIAGDVSVLELLVPTDGGEQ